MRYYINPTKNTPYVNLDIKKGLIEFKGVSSPSNSIAFYDKIFKVLNLYRKSSNKELEVNMAFTHFNTSSSKCLFDILKAIKVLEKSGKDVTINWFYEQFDEDMREVGEDYSDVINMPFLYFEMDN